MVENDGGSIVLSAAAVARTGVFNHEAIAANGGSIGLTRAASTYARNAVRVNCVAPGLMETPLTERLTQDEARGQPRAVPLDARAGRPARRMNEKSPSPAKG